MKAERYVMVMASQGDTRFWRELLELILAGASLDLDLLVLFESAALDSLCRSQSEIRAWRQLVDHELCPVRVVARSEQTSDLPDWIEPVSEHQATAWRREATEIFA